MFVFLVMMLQMMKGMEERGSGGVTPEKYVYRRIEWYCWWIVTPMRGENEKGKARGKQNRRKLEGCSRKGPHGSGCGHHHSNKPEKVHQCCEIGTLNRITTSSDPSYCRKDHCCTR